MNETAGYALVIFFVAVAVLVAYNKITGRNKRKSAPTSKPKGGATRNE